jgi:predicted transcriptional regulator
MMGHFMAESTTLTVRLSNESKTRLAELAHRTRRTSSFLAAEAIEAYVTRELAIIGAIEQGRDQIRAGESSTHDDVARDARALIQAARAKS